MGNSQPHNNDVSRWNDCNDLEIETAQIGHVFWKRWKHGLFRTIFSPGIEPELCTTKTFFISTSSPIQVFLLRDLFLFLFE